MIEKIILQFGLCNFSEVVLPAVEMATKYNSPVVFEFNSVQCVLEPGDTAANMGKAYLRALGDENPGKKVAFGNGTYDITT